MNLLIFNSFLLILNAFVYGHDLKGFDDTVLFKLNWPGHSDLLMDQSYEEEPLFVTTNKKEKYQCMIPNLETKEKETETPYTGLAPLDLIASLFSSAACSYRIESYWTYEVCHGNYIKQYHEEREGKSSKLQEYYLGQWNKQKTDMLRTKLAQDENEGTPLKYKKIEGLNLPYLELEMSDGTACGLIKNEPRVTKVLYVCYAHGKNDIYSLREVSTCNYEVIVLTPNLCTHPNFRPQGTADNVINCVPMNEQTPNKPRILVAMEVESMKLQYQKLADVTKNLQDIALVKVDPKDGSLRMEFLQADRFRSTIAEEFLEDNSAKTTTPQKLVKLSRDTSPVTAFLQGKNCLTGGTGWWKYEFCYGRYVRQFHEDKKGKTSVILGFFDEELHKKWLNENKSKRPQPIGQRTHLSHFYQGGTICEKTGKRRQTEIKLKCMDSTTSATAVSLYLMEPKTCNYVLGVESPLICDILQKADENGLIHTANESEENGKNVEEVFLGNAYVEDIEVRFEND